MSYATVTQNTVQEGARSFEGQNPYATAIQSPVNIPFSEIRDYKNPFHGFDGYYGTYAINPYFVLNEYQNNGKINNMLANLSLTYNPIANLTLSTRLGATTAVLTESHPFLNMLIIIIISGKIIFL